GRRIRGTAPRTGRTSGTWTSCQDYPLTRRLPEVQPGSDHRRTSSGLPLVSWHDQLAAPVERFLLPYDVGRHRLPAAGFRLRGPPRSEEHTSELQSPYDLVCRLLLEKKK